MPKRKLAEGEKPVRVRLTKKNLEKICDQIASGKDLTTVCEELKGFVPTARSVRRAQAKDPEIHEAITRAYDAYFQVKADEIERLSLEGVPKEVEAEGKIAINSYIQNKRLRIDTLKFQLAKLAPMLSARFDKAETKREEEAAKALSGPTIQIISYGTPEPKDVVGSETVTIEVKKDE